MDLARQCIDHLERAQEALVSDLPEVDMLVKSLNAEYLELEDDYQDLMLFYTNAPPTGRRERSTTESTPAPDQVQDQDQGPDGLSIDLDSTTTTTVTTTTTTTVTTVRAAPPMTTMSTVSPPTTVTSPPEMTIKNGLSPGLTETIMSLGSRQVLQDHDILRRKPRQLGALAGVLTLLGGGATIFGFLEHAKIEHLSDNVHNIQFRQDKLVHPVHDANCSITLFMPFLCISNFLNLCF